MAGPQRVKSKTEPTNYSLPCMETETLHGVGSWPPEHPHSSLCSLISTAMGHLLRAAAMALPTGGTAAIPQAVSQIRPFLCGDIYPRYLVMQWGRGLLIQFPSLMDLLIIKVTGSLLAFHTLAHKYCLKSCEATSQLMPPTNTHTLTGKGKHMHRKIQTQTHEYAYTHSHKHTHVHTGAHTRT